MLLVSFENQPKQGSQRKTDPGPKSWLVAGAKLPEAWRKLISVRRQREKCRAFMSGSVSAPCHKMCKAHRGRLSSQNLLKEIPFWMGLSLAPRFLQTSKSPRFSFKKNKKRHVKGAGRHRAPPWAKISHLGGTNLLLPLCKANTNMYRI